MISLLLLLALVVFLLAALGASSRINLTALGLALYMLALLVTRFRIIPQ